MQEMYKMEAVIQHIELAEECASFNKASFKFSSF